MLGQLPCFPCGLCQSVDCQNDEQVRADLLCESGRLRRFWRRVIKWKYFVQWCSSLLVMLTVISSWVCEKVTLAEI